MSTQANANKEPKVDKGEANDFLLKKFAMAFNLKIFSILY